MGRGLGGWRRGCFRIIRGRVDLRVWREQSSSENGHGTSDILSHKIEAGRFKIHNQTASYHTFLYLRFPRPPIHR